MNQGNAQGQKAAPGSVFKLTRASVPIDIPMAKGYENGNEIFFIGTDASDQKIAKLATKLLGFKVNFAPLLLHLNQREGKLMPSPMVLKGKDHLDFKFPY